MADPIPYANGAAVERAISESAKTAAQRSNGTWSRHHLMQLADFERFLSRIFIEGESSRWVLKGGTSILARVPGARSTQDIDLLRAGSNGLDADLQELKALATTDLGDHYRFEYHSQQMITATEAQPYVDGYRVTFDTYLGVKKKSPLRVDLVSGVEATDQVTTLTRTSPLDLPRLVSHPWRLYPVVDQVADKVCATMMNYHGRSSSRTKDLVDLVVMATTQNIDGSLLRRAITREMGRRRIPPEMPFAVPADWEGRYPLLSRSTPACREFRSFGDAVDLVVRLVDPVLANHVAYQRWSARALSWQKAIEA